MEQAGAVVAGCAFVIELGFLNGRERLAGYDVHSLVTYESDRPCARGGSGGVSPRLT